MKLLKTKKAIQRALDAGKVIECKFIQDKDWEESLINQNRRFERIEFEHVMYRVKPEPPIYKTYQGWKRKVKQLWPDVEWHGNKDICQAIIPGIGCRGVGGMGWRNRNS